MATVTAGYASSRRLRSSAAGRPQADWRAETGYGWSANVWFRSWSEARTARAAIRSEGWVARSLGRKIRVGVRDGGDAQSLAEFVLERRTDVRRIQLRCD